MTKSGTSKGMRAPKLVSQKGQEDQKRPQAVSQKGREDPKKCRPTLGSPRDSFGAIQMGDTQNHPSLCALPGCPGEPCGVPPPALALCSPLFPSSRTSWGQPKGPFPSPMAGGTEAGALPPSPAAARTQPGPGGLLPHIPPSAERGWEAFAIPQLASSPGSRPRYCFPMLLAPGKSSHRPPEEGSKVLRGFYAIPPHAPSNLSISPCSFWQQTPRSPSLLRITPTGRSRQSSVRHARPQNPALPPFWQGEVWGVLGPVGAADTYLAPLGCVRERGGQS